MQLTHRHKTKQIVDVAHMKVEKQKFDLVLDRLIRAEPQTRSATKPDKKRKPKKTSRKT
jgi:hypothetical protein